jgi:hypothetical protein
MSHLSDAHEGSVSIFLQSNKATRDITDANKVWELEEQIVADPHINLLISLTSLELPYAFYNVNATNNKLSIKASSSNTFAEIEVDSKNYSGTQLATALTSALSATAVTGVIGFVITCAFDDTTNKFTFNSSGSVADPKNYTIGTNTTLLKELGLRGQLPLTSAVGILISPNVCNLSGTSSCYLRINNLSINNRDSRGNLSGILAKININANPGEFIFYNAFESIYYQISDRVISSLDITLTDDNGNELLLNGIDWSATLTINQQKIREREIPQKYLLSEIEKLREGNNEINDKQKK